jgi:hypothetical protein
MIADKASIPPSTISHQPSAYRPVNRLLLDSVPLACEIERFDPQAPP